MEKETKKTLELGQVVQTRAIYEATEKDETFKQEVYKAFSRYTSLDWGDTCQEDKELNDSAVENNDDRVVAKYNTSKGAIFIITEWDRSTPLILFANEY